MFPANRKSSKYRGANPAGGRACRSFMRFGIAASILLFACGKTAAGDLVSSVEFDGQAIIAGGEIYGTTDKGLISLPLDGGQPRFVVPTGRPADVPFGAIVVSPDEVFWTGSSLGLNDFGIEATSRQGGATREMARIEGADPDRLFGDAANLYWSSTRGRGTVSGTTAVLQTMPSAGGDVVTLLSEPHREYTVAGVDSSRIYFFALATGEATSSLNAIAIDGGGPVVQLATGGEVGQCCFTLVDGKIIWSSGFGLRTTDVTTGITTDRSDLSGGDGMVADARGGFIADSSCQEPTEVDDATCSYSLRDLNTGRFVASATSAVGGLEHGMALDETWVYWTVSGQGLYRVRR
jgi:hypothetical protein